MAPDAPPDAKLNGLIVVDKPLGWSSMDVVRVVRAAAGGTKTGHAGTLDPLASGVVVCCLGKATRLVEQLMGLTKVYETEVDLSAFTTTDDREGPRQEVPVSAPPMQEQVREALRGFVGVVQQAPPPYSAVKIEGQRAYKLARRGEAVTPQARPVRIDAIDVLAYHWPILHLRITCGRGTYIRSLARDLGKALHTGGHLASLRRLSVGPYDLSIAVDEARLRRPITQADLLPPPVQVQQSQT
jgi:tRNA pseudouridine55 synthase